jgi:branched-chain amino acid transport system substrate-binding protein
MGGFLRLFVKWVLLDFLPKEVMPSHHDGLVDPIVVSAKEKRIHGFTTQTSWRRKIMKRVLTLLSLLVIASMLAACGGAAGGGGTLKIVSSLPMTGSSLTQTQTIVNAMQLRLEQAGGKACDGRYTITYEAWDDASAALGQWDPAVETENANKAAADESVIAYLGTFNSGAARLSIPILNGAGPLVMISPANTNPGLTKADKDEPGVTDSYYPTGVRSYARVVAADDIQGKVAANFVKSLGAETVYVLDDQQLYGKGIADVFVATAGEIGLTIVGHEGIDTKAADYKALMTKISTSNAGGPPDAIYVGMVVDSNASQLLKDKVAIMGDNETVKFVGPDGIQTQAFIDGAGADVAEGVYASVAGVPFAELPAAGQQFVKDYEAKYGKLTEPYAVYGYETMSVALKAIEDVCAAGGDPTNRQAVRDAVFAIKNFEGALGTWSFDANGDTSLTDMTFYQVQGGGYAPVGTFK